MDRLPKKRTAILAAFCLAALAAADMPAPLRAAPAGYEIQSFPVPEALQSEGRSLSADSKDWMKKWRGMNLEDSASYTFKELSGSTSINMKIEKIDASDPKGYKSRGSFVPRNSSANPDIEIAAFNLSAILGYDQIYRPAARYELGPIASQALKSLIGKYNIHGSARLANKARILKAIESGSPLKGCVKAKKDDTGVAFDAIANTHAASNGAPNAGHPIIRFLQAANDKPTAGKSLILKTGYDGDELELAREYSVIMTIDAITQQWDRYSGGNVAIRKDDQGRAHFYMTDNGGADLSDSWNARNLTWFSRFDRGVIQKLDDLKRFLDTPATGYLGYSDPEVFVADLGLYSQNSAAINVQRLRRNLGFVLDYVRATETKFGDKAFFD
ncbi:hypothetical protein ACNJX9_03990 [Bradyrhizobium sp. DASA03076]|uniref:hypothetical protein n=1 Tax=Bradyrhizobium sp. BLXBL-03 TaxID=3395916 RepID=UPI003F71D3FF